MYINCTSNMDSYNYKEYVMFKNSIVDSSSTAIFDINIDETTFKQTLLKMEGKNNNYKYFQRECKEYVFSDIIYKIYNDDEIKIYKLIPMDMNISDKSNTWIECIFQKNKLSLINVPSNINYDTLSYIKTLTFRISNRIYVNFEVKKTDDVISYKIFINYNHDANVDNTEIEKQIAHIITLLS